ncbi:MAG: metal ABC transporter substrate-binding protein [Methanotrichaceae archaeon]
MRSFHVLVLVILIVGLCGCISTDDVSDSDRSGKVKVVATIVPLGHFAEIVGGDKVNVAVLIQPGTSPHTFETSPSQMKLIENADLYVKNGAGLEIWMDKIIQANKNMFVVDSSTDVDLIKMKQGDHGSHESIRTTDPHIWLSPRNAAIQVKNICDGLIQIDPSNADYYRKNRDNYILKLEDLDSDLNDTFSGSEERKFIVLHPAWSYFARDYGLEQIPILSSEKEPGPKYLTTIVDKAREKNITIIFVDPNFNPKSAEIVAKEIDGRTVPLDPLAENYLENMKYVGSEIASSLVYE